MFKYLKVVISFNFLMIIPCLSFAAIYVINDGNLHNQDYVFNDNDVLNRNLLRVENGSKLRTNITIDSAILYASVDKDSTIDAVFNINSLLSAPYTTSRIQLFHSRNDNKIVVNNNFNNLDIAFFVALTSSNGELEINNNGSYSEVLAGDANYGEPFNPDIVKLKHNFYGNSKADVRWIDSDINGDIILSDNAYAYYDAFVKANFSGSMTVNDRSKLDFVLLAASNGGAKASIINSDINVNQNSEANFWFGDKHYGSSSSQAVLNGNMIVSDNANGNILTNSWGGVWNGDLITNDNAKGNYLINRDDSPKSNWNRWTGNALANDNSIIDIVLQRGTTWIGQANQLDNSIIDIKIEDTSTGSIGTEWQLTNNSNINRLSLHHGKIYLSASSTDFSQFNSLTTDNLAGTGLFIFNTDIAKNSGDKLVVNNTIDTGNKFSIDINNQAGAYTKAYQDLLLVKTKKSENDAFALTHNVEVGGYEYSLIKKGENWYLSTPDYLPSSTLKTAIGSAYSSYLLDIANKDVLIQRQGNLRSNTQTTGNVWIKNFGGRINHIENNNVGLLDDLEMSYYGLQIGVDKQIEGTNSFIGFTTGYMTASQHYGANNKGSGSTDSFNVGAYFTSLYDNNTYLNLTAKYSYYSNDFTAVDTAGAGVNGDTSTKTLSASTEIGYKHTFKHLYLEPFAQLSLTHFPSNSLRTSNDLAVDIDSYNSFLSKIGINVGIGNFDNKNTQLYFKTAVIKEFLANIDVTANDVKDSSNFKNHWFSSGFGMTSEFAKNHHLYSDVEFTYGGGFKNAQINLGYLFNF